MFFCVTLREGLQRKEKVKSQTAHRILQHIFVMLQASVILTALSVPVCRKTAQRFQKCHVTCENIGCLKVLQLTQITEPHCRFHVRKGADGPIDKPSHKQTN